MRAPVFLCRQILNGRIKKPLEGESRCLKMEVCRFFRMTETNSVSG
jgi:hypothetical protein